MTVTLNSSVFALTDPHSTKAAPALIAADDHHFATIAIALDAQVAELTARLDATRRAPGGDGQAALDRDLEIHRLTARLRTLRRFGLDLCLGRVITEGEESPRYIGRLSLRDSDGSALLVDWRTPAAEPFFAATYANPLGLASRRRYRWNRGRITDYWDEAFTESGRANVALDDDSALIASLGSSRSPRMRDVLSTIQSDQDAIIRAGSRGALVVDGGPGTGKTVVALHRSAYLLYADPRLGRSGSGGILFVGPHQPYLAYVADVLPSLGEEGVQTATLRNLVAEGVDAAPEPDERVAALKSSAMLVAAVESAVVYYERPPVRDQLVETPWADVWVTTAEWEEAFDAGGGGVLHNEARELVWDELVSILVDKLSADHDDEVPAALMRRALAQDDDLVRTFARAWPILDPVAVVGDLWSAPNYLARCAPWLTADEVALLQRSEPRAWTESDLPFLDAARQRIGDPEDFRRRRREKAIAAAERERMETVVEELIASDDSELGIMSILRGEDARNSLDDDAVLPSSNPDALAGPFAHIVVDEAQELTDAEWQMLVQRCPSRSFTIVGDRAQASHGFLRDGRTESWSDRLERVGLGAVTVATLSINYRTPEEIMAHAEPVIRGVLPDANVPTAIRRSGKPVRRRRVADLGAVLNEWLAANEEGIACVIRSDESATDGVVDDPRVRVLSPDLSKGLEFDLVVLIEPESFGDGIEGAARRYVAMTRATSELVVLE